MLLADPGLSGPLTSFANDLLGPLLAHDAEKDSRLTETLALVLTSQSAEEVAQCLYVYPKTVPYRIRRAQEILGKKLDSPTDRIALSMAAFVWTSHRQNPP